MFVIERFVFVIFDRVDCIVFVVFGDLAARFVEVWMGYHGQELYL